MRIWLGKQVPPVDQPEGKGDRLRHQASKRSQAPGEGSSASGSGGGLHEALHVCAYGYGSNDGGQNGQDMQAALRSAVGRGTP